MRQSIQVPAKNSTKIRSLCFGAVTGTEVEVAARAGEAVASSCAGLTAITTGVEAGAQEVSKRMNSKKLMRKPDRMVFG